MGIVLYRTHYVKLHQGGQGILKLAGTPRGSPVEETLPTLFGKGEAPVAPRCRGFAFGTAATASRFSHVDGRPSN
jgi:hypothetical protein